MHANNIQVFTTNFLSHASTFTLSATSLLSLMLNKFTQFLGRRHVSLACGLAFAVVVAASAWSIQLHRTGLFLAESHGLISVSFNVCLEVSGLLAAN